MPTGVYDRKLGVVYGMSGRHHKDETKNKIRLFLKGQKRPDISRAKKGKKLLHLKKWQFKKGQKVWNKGLIGWNAGEKSPSWKGGVSKTRKMGAVYKQWRSDVFERDNWTCQTCGVRGGYLEAHHIKSWAKYPELRYEVENGVTLCLDCHRLTFKNK